MMRRRSIQEGCALVAVSCLLCLVVRWTAEGQQPPAAGPPANKLIPVARVGSPHFWHGAVIRALAFSPGDKLLASLGQDKRVCIWDTTTGKLVQAVSIPNVPPAAKSTALKSKAGVVTSTIVGPLLAFAADGKLLTVIDPTGRRYHVYDTTTGKELHQIPMPDEGHDPVVPEKQLVAKKAAAVVRKSGGPFALSRAGRLLATGHGKGNAIVVWDLEKGAERCRLQGHDGPVAGLAFAPDGKALVSAGGGEPLVRLWDVQTGKLLRTFAGHRAAVQDVAFLADGRILSASTDCTLRLWDRDSGKMLHRLLWLPTPAGDSAPSQNVQLWHDGGKRVGCLVLGVDLTPGSAPASVLRAAAAAAPSFFVCFDAATGRELCRTLLQPGSQAAGVRVVGSERPLLARASPSNHIELISLETGGPVTDHAGAAPVRDVSLAGDHLAVVREGSPDIELWDWRTGQLLRRLEGHTGPPLLAGFTPNGRTLVSWSESVADSSVTWWDVPGGSERGHVVGRAIAALPATKSSAFLEASRATVVALPRPAVSPDGKFVVLGGRDGRVQVMDITTNKEVARVGLPWNGSTAVAFTPDSKSLVLCDSLGTRTTAKGKKGKAAKDEKPPPSGCGVRLLDLQSGVLGAEVGRRHNFFVRRMEVAGGHALVACTDGLIRVLDLATGEELRAAGEDPRLKAPPAKDPKDPLAKKGFAKKAFEVDTFPRVTADRSPQFVLSPDGRTLAVLQTKDRSVQLWEVATNGQRGHITGHPGPITCVRFSADGRHLITGSQDGTVLIWSLVAPAARPGAPRPEWTDQELEALWADLGADSPRALEAMQQLTACPPQALKLLRGHLRPVPVDEQRLQQLLLDLDDRSFARREKAEKELAGLGEVVMPALHQALKSKPAPEAQTRMEKVLKVLRGGTVVGERLREVRGVEVLEALASAEADALLRQLARGAPGARLTREARAALERSRLRAGS
ncbi:MAG: hypothetical protein L0Z62_00370 [Gemmataceae bacterium]|nr:hypothetical protein [Gemmataceae bacterium]